MDTEVTDPQVDVDAEVCRHRQPDPCLECGGDRTVTRGEELEPGVVNWMTVTCPSCHGTGTRRDLP